MPPIQVDIITPLPEGWGVCTSCEMLIAQADLHRHPAERGLDEYPPEWQADFQRFSEALINLSLRYGDSVLFRIWGPRSLQGLVKAVRFGAHRYPTFVVKGVKKVVGLDLQALELALQAGGAVVQPPENSAAQP